MHRGGGVHTVPARNDDGWCNERRGKVLCSFRNKEEAVVAGREIARSLREEHTIHRKDGAITEKNSYGNDPHPPRG